MVILRFIAVDDYLVFLTITLNYQILPHNNVNYFAIRGSHLAVIES